MKTFTLDEAQSLLPVLESLLKRAMEGKQSAEEVESELSEMARRIYVSGGMRVDVTKVAKLRAAMEADLQLARESIAEIDSIGVQVKDLDGGLLDFPCRLDDQTRWFCCAGTWARRPSSSGTRLKPAIRAASPWTSASAAAPPPAAAPTEPQSLPAAAAPAGETSNRKPPAPPTPYSLFPPVPRYSAANGLSWSKFLNRHPAPGIS
jgi:hypothetical protein